MAVTWNWLWHEELSEQQEKALRSRVSNLDASAQEIAKDLDWLRERKLITQREWSKLKSYVLNAARRAAGPVTNIRTNMCSPEPLSGSLTTAAGQVFTY